MRKACYQDLIEKYENPLEHACDMEENRVSGARHEAAGGLLRQCVAEPAALRDDLGTRGRRFL